MKDLRWGCQGEASGQLCGEKRGAISRGHCVPGWWVRVQSEGEGITGSFLKIWFQEKGVSPSNCPLKICRYEAVERVAFDVIVLETSFIQNKAMGFQKRLSYRQSCLMKAQHGDPTSPRFSRKAENGKGGQRGGHCEDSGREKRPLTLSPFTPW